MEDEIEKQIKSKIVLLGDAKTGKSSISRRLLDNKFEDEYNVLILL